MNIMKHVTAPFTKQIGTTTSNANSSHTIRRNSYWAGKITLMLLFLLASQLGVVAQNQCDPPINPSNVPGTLISEMRTNCDATGDLNGQSGNVFELMINPANEYVFKLCFDTPIAGNSQFPFGEIWSDTTGMMGTFIASSIGPDASNCSSVTYTPDDDCSATGSNLIYLSTYSHSCDSDWRELTIEVDCSACEIECGTPQFQAATASGCTSVAFDVASPSVTGSCDGNVITYTASTDIEDYVFPSVVTVLTTGATTIPVAPMQSGTIEEGESVTVSAGAPVGTHTITFSVTDCAGEVETCDQVIIIEPVLACDDVVNVTLSQFCELQITPGMLLEAECADDSQYEVNILGLPGDIVSEPGLYEVQIAYEPDVPNSASGTFCWGFVNVEDKSGPTCTIENPSVHISCGEEFEAEAPVFEDCSGDVTSTMITLEFGNCGDITFPFRVNADLEIPMYDDEDPNVEAFTDNGFVFDHVTVNMWTATDANGLTSTSCQQYIYTWRPSTVIRPLPSVTVECGSSIDQDSLAAIDPRFVPHYVNPLFDMNDDESQEFLPITNVSNVCGFNVDSDDNLLGEFCGMTAKYIRNFTVVDWCNGGFEEYSQIIAIEDSTAPEIDEIPMGEMGESFDNPIVLETTASATAICGFDGMITPPIATDFCSTPLTYTGSVLTSGGTGVGYVLVSQVQDFSNNISLPFRDYRIDFYARDECGNVSEPRSVFYDIRDNTKPVVICDQLTTVSLTNAVNGTAVICADNLDSGSTDNCGIASRQIRRMNTDQEFADCLDLSCDDAGQEVIVELKVEDEAGNYNLCWVTVTVEDKSHF